MNVQIRKARIEDAEAILHIQREVIAENDYFISVTEEFQKTEEEQRGWIQEISEKSRNTLLVAEINNKVVGWLVFLSQDRKRLMHTGSFGVMIHKDYRGKGVGKKLIEELIQWAEQNPKIEKICLGVFHTNQRAIALYKQLGFIEEGRKIREFKFDENEYVDDILMYRLV
ncbi:GNAT family N-acetyltransferase [Bacillus sp. BHET2]|nr:GNAT family N-acetyltransferase [Bacillus sp. BHET2]